MQLRYYQQEAKKRVYDAFREGKRSVMLQIPTGGGKTIIFASMINDGQNADPPRRTLILAHRKELIEQAADKLKRGYGVESGIIKAGIEPDYNLFSQVGSVQSVINRELPHGIDLCIIDEAHHVQNDNSYGKIKERLLEQNPNCKFLGVTATPVRLNGRGFENIFETLIEGISIEELINHDPPYLVKPKYYLTPIDLGKIKMTGGDYNQKELADAYEGKVSNQELIDNWKDIADGLQTIGFAINIEHSQSIVAYFKKCGIRAEHIDGGTDPKLRSELIRKFADKEIQVLYNVGVFDEGFDVPGIECVQLARPTKSLVKYMQMVGRGLRPAEGKDACIILDNAGLLVEHGPVELPRHWELKGTKSEKPYKTKLMAQDEDTGELWEPERLFDDIPHERRKLKLIEVDVADLYKITPEMAANLFNNYEKQRINLGRKPFWVWYRMAGNIKTSSRYLAEIQLTALAKEFIKHTDYKPGFAYHLAHEYVEKNLEIFINP